MSRSEQTCGSPIASRLPIDRRILEQIGSERLATAMKVLRELSQVINETLDAASTADQTHLLKGTE